MCVWGGGGGRTRSSSGPPVLVPLYSLFCWLRSHLPQGVGLGPLRERERERARANERQERARQRAKEREPQHLPQGLCVQPMCHAHYQLCKATIRVALTPHPFTLFALSTTSNMTPPPACALCFTRRHPSQTASKAAGYYASPINQPQFHRVPHSHKALLPTCKPAPCISPLPPTLCSHP